MKSKIIAVAAVMVMVLSGLVLISADTEAEGENIVYRTVVVPHGGIGNTSGVDVEFAFSEQELVGYDYEMTIQSGEYSGDVTTVDYSTTLGTVSYDKDAANNNRNFKDGSAPTYGGIITDIASSDSVGQFTMNFTASANTSAASIVVRCTATVTAAGESTPIDPIYYVFNVVAYDNSDDANAGIRFTLTAINDLYVGQVVDEAVTIDGYDIDEAGFYWYATGLPAGLSMSSNGHITGVPLEAVTNQTINVVMTERSGGNQFEATLTITVSAYADEGEVLGNNDFTYKVNVEDSSDVKTSPQNFIAESGDTVVLMLTRDGAAAQDVTVTIVGEIGTVTTQESGSTGIVNLDALGTGTFKVIMSCDTNSPTDSAVTKTFYLHVLPSVEDIVADITISSQP